MRVYKIWHKPTQRYLGGRNSRQCKDKGVITSYFKSLYRWGRNMDDYEIHAFDLCEPRAIIQVEQWGAGAR